MDRELSRPYILFGGDYNPDQWDDETIDKDIEIFKQTRINTVTLPVFSWAKLEPSEGVYSFEWLDHILDKLDENGLSYFLATPTSAQPAWLSKKYPEVLPVDISGRKRTHGMRVFFCVNSPKFRERAAAIAGKMASRYKDRKGLIGWHVANEYGTYCYCENCQNKFRQWLKNRYGTIDELNIRWHTCFWGKTLYDFEEVMLPTELNDDYRFNPAVQLDYMRFMTDSTIECYENEAEILKAATPHLPVFTNISGFIKKLDQSKMVPRMDTAGWDNYPWPNQGRSVPAMKHDIMRALKAGESFYVMEQSPNQQNWQPYNKLKRPGEVRRLAYQGMAHGSDSSLYFQMRQSIAGQEKFHGAVISHSGRTDTRIIREFTRLGEELEKLGDAFICGKTDSEVGIMFDWNNWWALELTSGPTKDMDYLGEVHKYYEPLYYGNYSVDFLIQDVDFAKYKVIIAPMLYMIKDGIAEKLRKFTEEGGILIGTYMTGYADENDRCIFGAYPGPLRDVFGIWVEETDALYEDEYNRIHEIDNVRKKYNCSFLCDLIHITTAEVKAVYEEDFYRGMPAVTVNNYGKGKAYYIASSPDDSYLEKLYGEILKEAKVRPVLESSGEIEVTKREKDGEEIFFAINHGNAQGKINTGKSEFLNLLNNDKIHGTQTIPAGDVFVLKRTK